nr:MAG TPA: hypothetical protein [Caudoviricetes sp.]
MMKYSRKHIDNLFNEEMTRNEVRSVFFKALDRRLYACYEYA